MTPQLSVFSMSNVDPRRVAAALAPLRHLDPEVVLAVDDRMDPAWVDGYRAVADRVVLVEFPGFFNRLAGWLRAQCSGRWIVGLDADEVPSTAFAAELETTIAQDDITHAWVPRLWLHGGRDRALAQWPWRPDYSLRVTRNDPAVIRTPGLAHLPIAAIGPKRYLRSPLYHLDLLLNDEAARRAKVERYERERPGLRLAGRTLNEALYLPELEPDLRYAPLPDEDRATIDAFLDRTTTLGAPRAAAERATPAEVTATWEQRAIGDGAYRAALRPLDDDRRIVAGDTRTFDVEVENLGDEIWPGGWDAAPQIRVGTRWLPAYEEALRTAFGGPVAPGESIVVPVEVTGPKTPGGHVLAVDLVHEGVRWFDCGFALELEVVAR